MVGECEPETQVFEESGNAKGCLARTHTSFLIARGLKWGRAVNYGWGKNAHV